MKNRNLYERAGKRLIDIMVSIFALVFLSPVFLAVAIFSAFCTKQNPIFIQMRIGKDGKMFKLYKFRTMKDAIFQGKPCKVITKRMKILRWVSLDELPQFWNILCGNMSIVGPRPVIFNEFLECNGINNYPCRLKVKPGLIPVSMSRGIHPRMRHSVYLHDCDYANNRITFKKDLTLIIQAIRYWTNINNFQQALAVDAIELT